MRINPCSRGSMPFPSKQEGVEFEEPPLSLMDPPLAYMSHGIGWGKWSGPTLEIHGSSSYTMLLEGRGRRLEAWPQPPYEKRCLWIPPACPAETFMRLAEKLAGLRRSEASLVNYMPRSFLGVVETSEGRFFAIIPPGSAISLDHGGLGISGETGAGPGEYRLGSIKLIIGVDSLSIVARRSEFRVELGGRPRSIRRHAAWVSLEAGRARLYASGKGLEVIEAGELVVRHEYYNPLVLWMHPFSIAAERMMEGRVEAWWVSICGSYCISAASPMGVTVALEEGSAVIRSNSRLLSLTPHPPGFPALAIEEAARTRCRPEVRGEAPAATPLWRLDAGGVLLYDAWLKDEKLYVVLVNLGEPRVAVFRLLGLIREAWLSDAWLKEHERLAASYDRVKVPLPRGPAILVLEVARSPLIGLRKVWRHGVT